MTVQQLIAALAEMPFDKDVKIVYDGEPRMDAAIVFESKDDTVVVTGYNEPLYSDKARPKYAPSEYEKKVIHTKKEDDDNTPLNVHDIEKKRKGLYTALSRGQISFKDFMEGTRKLDGRECLRVDLSDYEDE